jgi:UDP:flavonoid glycosyltransferase YjiC (YdhE family)
LPGHEVTPERLREAVETVANSPHIRRQVARMRMDMLAAGGPARAAQLVDGWLNEPSPAAEQSNGSSQIRELASYRGLTP